LAGGRVAESLGAEGQFLDRGKRIPGSYFLARGRKRKAITGRTTTSDCRGYAHGVFQSVGSVHGGMGTRLGQKWGGGEELSVNCDQGEEELGGQDLLTW